MKRFLLLLGLVVASGSTVGCTVDNGDGSSSSENADALRVFSVTKGGSPNNSSVLGIWEAARPQTSGPLTSTSRFEFREAFVVAAARCTREGTTTPVTVGGRASATVSADTIQINQAISDQRSIGGSDAACGVQASAGVLPACDPNSAPASRTVCFELTGTTLDIYQGSGNLQSFVKIAD